MTSIRYASITSSVLRSSKLRDLDAALEVLGDFLDVVLEPLEGLDRPLVDLAALADQPGLGRALDRPLGDEAAGDGADLGDLEDLPDHGAAEVDLLDLGDEHPLDGLLDLVGDLVDDVVAADLDLLLVGQRDGPVLGGDAEADDDRLRGVGQEDVALGDPADALEEDADRDLGVLELLELLDQGLERALDVGLEDQVEALDLLLGHLAVEVLERDGLALAEGDAAGAEPAGLGDLAGAGDVVDDGELLAGGRARRRGRRPRRASTGRPRSTERPLSSKRARTRPKPSPQTITSPTVSVPSWTRTVATHAAALGDRRLQAGAGRRPVGVGLQLVQLGDDLEHLEQVGDAPGR